MKLFTIILLTFLYNTLSCQEAKQIDNSQKIELINSTFLGNYQRNYYGNSAPERLNIKWQHHLGTGKTTISRKIGEKIWSGAGWTGQPLLVKENGQLMIIQGAYDHHLKKINASSGKLVWEYDYNDVIKGTGTIWENKNSQNLEDRFVILQGSRLGYGIYLDAKIIPSYRAVSFGSGKELWKLNVKFTESYSRDVDGSALLINDTAYIGLENSLFIKFSPSPDSCVSFDGLKQPKVYRETYLYNSKDVYDHKGNVVTESSSCIIDSMIYIASGSGHIYGYNTLIDKITWDFYVGSDIDGSPVVTNDSCIIVTIEKQYIEGNGGAFKLNPRKQPKDAVVWFFPTESIEYESWLGGIIGSAAINDNYNSEKNNYLAAFHGIDGYLYLVNHQNIDSTQKVFGPNNKDLFFKPNMLDKYHVGPSISTPLIVGNKIISAGYGGLYLFEIIDNQLIKKEYFEGSFESTPIVHEKLIYLPSRNGYLYCLGD